MAKKVVKKPKKVKKGGGAKRGRKKEGKLSITSMVRSMMTKKPSVSSQEVIAAVLKKFPESKVNNAHVGFYRNKFRQEGLKIPSLRGKGKKKAVKKGKKVVKKGKKS